MSHTGPTSTDKILYLLLAGSFVTVSSMPPSVLAAGQEGSSTTLQGSVEKAGVMSMPTPNLEMPKPALPDNAGGGVKKGRVLDIYDEDFGKDYAKEDSSPLSGVIKKDALHGNVDDHGADLDARDGITDNSGNVLHGRAERGGSALVGQDPDMDDQELMVEWDKWRNRFLWAVQSGVQETLNNPEDAMLRWDPERQAVVMKFPLGTTAWFACTVNNQRKIDSLKLMNSSGFPGYDKAVLDSVRALEGTSILRFPRRSKRQVVNQTAGIKTSETGGRQFFQFGDVERYRMQY